MNVGMDEDDGWSENEESASSRGSPEDSVSETEQDMKEDPSFEIEGNHITESDDPAESDSDWTSSKEENKRPKTSKPKRKPLNYKYITGRCDLCHYKTGDKRHLQNHFEKVHPGVDLDSNVEFKCRHCDEYFKTTADVR